MLYGQDNGAFVQPIRSILVAPDQFFDNSRCNFCAFSVCPAVPRPARIGRYVYLRPVHNILSGSFHHFAVSIGHLIYQIKISVSHYGSANSQKVRVSDINRICMHGIRNGSMSPACFIFKHLRADIVIQRAHACLGTHIPTVNACGNFTLQHI